MSKGNMLLGHARGKVGSLVFSRSNGQQITRARAEQVKNPRTEAQMVQRIILNTIAQCYSRMSAICDHSFEGIKAGQDSMSYFMKRNTNLLRADLAEQGGFDFALPLFTEIGKNYLANVKLEISKGSLPTVNPLEIAADGILMDVSVNTYAGVINKYGLQRGDQLTFCAVVGSSANAQVFKYCRVILDPKNDDGTDAPLSTAFVTEGAITKPNGRNEINGFTFTFANSMIAVKPAEDVNQGCIIASREKEDGTWLRSNSLMVIDEGNAFGVNMATALDNFYASQLDIENPRYLNNANKGFKQQQAGVKYYNISTSASPSAGGSTTGAGRYEEGATVNVVATPNASYRFVRWTEDGVQVSTSATYSFTAAKMRSLVAVFQEVQTVLISASASPSAGGSVSGGGNIEQGSSCTLVATPAAGYAFVKWTENGQDVSTSASYTFTANANRTLVAVFEERQGVTITLQKEGWDGAQLTGAGVYNPGDEVTIYAPDGPSGYTFLGWRKDAATVTSQNSYTFTATENATYIAEYMSGD
ncbi:MAG: InlB B-repeat-containing protein [Alistipes sp.]|nr:InlB B-repeat-containing protein [Alistipes sp.]